MFFASFAQQYMSPLQQWKKFADPDTITCKPEHLLLQKNNGVPVCVQPSTYLTLVDRNYGSYDSSIMSNRPEMMNRLMQYMLTNEKLMYHWHEMLKNNPSRMIQTMTDLVSQMKSNPELLKNLLGPITSDPQLREKMVQIMQNHPNMEHYLKQNSEWMYSVHHSVTDYGMEQNMPITCQWCPNYQIHYANENMDFANFEKITDILHDMWVNSGKSNYMHKAMFEDPSHMAQMSEHMMEPMLAAVMDDEYLRQQMIDLMLKHDGFMNTIRHDNSVQEH